MALRTIQKMMPILKREWKAMMYHVVIMLRSVYKGPDAAQASCRKDTECNVTQ